MLNIVLCTGIGTERTEAGTTCSRCQSAFSGITGTRGWGNPLCLGNGVTVLQLDANPQKMQEFSETFQAHIIDMESYWIARIASARQIPFIAIRSISDTIQHSVQPFDQILASDGSLLWEKAVLTFLSHPQYLINVYTLYRNTRPAKRNLAAFIGYMVTGI